jgi:hypothetical protein
MAIAFDAQSAGAIANTAQSWTHTPVGIPRAVLLGIPQAGGTEDPVSGATYGGVTMALVRTDSQAAGEPGRVYWWFLGASIPTGPQTIAYTISTGIRNKQGYCYTATAAGDTEVDSSNGVALGIIANPSITVTHTGTLTGGTWAGFAAHHYGGAAPITTGLQAGETIRLTTDFGQESAMSYSRDATADAASSTYGYTTLASDDQLISAVVIKETAAATASLLVPSFRDTSSLYRR